MILSSRTWRQSGYVKLPVRKDSNRKNPLNSDADNRLLWKMTPRRLEAESVRDAMLVVAGSLNGQTGGPGYEDVSVISNNGTNYYESLNLPLLNNILSLLITELLIKIFIV